MDGPYETNKNVKNKRKLAIVSEGISTIEMGIYDARWIAYLPNKQNVSILKYCIQDNLILFIANVTI